MLEIIFSRLETSSRLNDVHNIRIVLQQLYLDSFQTACNVGHDLLGKDRDLRYEMLQRRDDLQAGYQHGDEENAVEHDGQQQRRNPLGQMQLFSKRLCRPLQRPGDNDAEDKRTQRRKQIAREEKRQYDEYGVISRIDQKTLFTFQIHGRTPFACFNTNSIAYNCYRNMSKWLMLANLGAGPLRYDLCAEMKKQTDCLNPPVCAVTEKH